MDRRKSVETKHSNVIFIFLLNFILCFQKSLIDCIITFKLNYLSENKNVLLLFYATVNFKF